MLKLLDSSSSTESDIITECNTNVTAQMLLTGIFVPHLSSIAAKGQPATFLSTTSGLGFVPVAFLSVYCSTKAAIHALALSLRQEINQSNDQNIKNNLSIVEVVPPFVNTDFAKQFVVPGMPVPMPLEEYLDVTMALLAEIGEDGRLLKEVAAGSAQARVDLWRTSIGSYMNKIGLDC